VAQIQTPIFYLYRELQTNSQTANQLHDALTLFFGRAVSQIVHLVTNVA